MSVGSQRSQNAGGGLAIGRTLPGSRGEIWTSLCLVNTRAAAPGAAVIGARGPSGRFAPSRSSTGRCVCPSAFSPRLAAAVPLRALNAGPKGGQRSRCRSCSASPELKFPLSFVHPSRNLKTPKTTHIDLKDLVPNSSPLPALFGLV